MSSYVSLCIAINSKLNLEGSCAFKRMPPGRAKAWKRSLFWSWKRSLFWLLWAASSLYELPALPPFPRQLQLQAKFLRLPQHILCAILHLFLHLYNILTNSSSRKNYFRKQSLNQFIFMHYILYICIIYYIYYIYIYYIYIFYMINFTTSVKYCGFLIFFFNQKAADILAHRQH